MSSVESFLFHPLTVRLEPARGRGRWRCARRVPGLGRFQVRFSPRERGPPVPGLTRAGAWQRRHTCLAESMAVWLRRRGVVAHKRDHGVVDVARRVIYPVDLLAEHDEELVFILAYYSHRRGGALWRENMEHARRMRASLEENYRLRGRVMVLNGYGEGRVWGAEIE
jgi:hypothetical protein